MDGHHRLAAYKTAGWKGDIPAIVFNGSLDEAVREALRRNRETKLPMTAKDRREAAWRLVKEGKQGEWSDSISEIQETVRGREGHSGPNARGVYGVAQRAIRRR